MAARFDAQSLLADKEAYYESVTRNIRWLGIAIVLLTFPPSHSFYPYLLVASAVAIVFNGLRYSALMRSKLFASRITTLVCDSILIAILIGLSGGPSSPYILFLIFTLISGAYWYGTRGMISILVFQVVSMGLTWRFHGPVAPDGRYGIAAVRLLSLVTIGILAERLTNADRSEQAVMTKANKAIEAQRLRMATLINSMVDPVLATDETNRVTVYNGAALDLLNTNERITEKPIDHYLNLFDSNNQPVVIKDLLSHGITKRNDLVLKLSEGSLVNVDLSIAPIRTSGPAVEGYIILIRDITKQKSIDQQRDEFIAVTSHELRTPVAIAEANLSTALLPNIASYDPKVKTLIEQAHQNIVFLGQLIKDLSTLAKAERGSLEVEVRPLDPAEIVHELAGDYQAAAAAKGLKLKTEVAKSIASVSSSLNLIHEVLQNFLTNAIKYTEKGSVTLAAEPAQGGRGVVFSVADTGIGISASDKKQLFTKFFRSEDYRTRKTNGTGLGLYVTKKLAERLGAELWCDSKLNSGSTFYLWVPPTLNDAPPPQQEPKNSVKSALKQFVES